MKRTLIALLGGVAMAGMVSIAHAEIEFSLFDADEDGFVTQEEFGTGLDNAENFEGDEGFFGMFDADDDGFLGLDEVEDQDEAYFDTYDVNDDQRLDRDEYYGGVFTRYDADNDTILNDKEFGLFGTDFGLL